MCDICNTIEKSLQGENPFFVKELESGIVVLGWNQHFYGYTIFMCKKHATELYQLEDEFLAKFMEEMPEMKLIEPEGTYLIWLDFRALGLTKEALHTLIEEKAGLWLDEGDIFGPEGEGFERINSACPRKTLEEALKRIRTAVSSCPSL